MGRRRVGCWAWRPNTARTSVRASARPCEIFRFNRHGFDYAGTHSFFGALHAPVSHQNSAHESPERLLNPGSQTANRFLAGTALDEAVAAAVDFE